MASNINFVANGYSGEVLEHLLSYTVNGNDTADMGLIHIEPGIQMKKTLPHIQIGPMVQDNVPTPRAASGSDISADSRGSVTHSERYLEPKDFMLYMEFNPRDYESFWRAWQPQGELLWRELDPKLQAKMLELIMAKKNDYIGDALWMSKKGGKDATLKAPAGCRDLGGLYDDDPEKYYDGVMARLLYNISLQAKAENTLTNDEKNEMATGKVILAGNTTLTTGEQVEQALRTMWSKIPKRLRNKSGFKFIMGIEAWDLYSNYLTDKHHKYGDNTADNTMRFKSTEIKVINGIPEHTIVWGRFTSDMDSCLWMGVDYVTDQTSIKVDRLQANSELWFVQMRMKMDVNIVKPGEIVVHTAYAA